MSNWDYHLKIGDSLGGLDMPILTHNKEVTSSIKSDQIEFYFIPSSPNLLSAQSIFRFDAEQFEDLMTEGYLAMADEHVKFAQDCICIAEEILPDWE